MKSIKCNLMLLVFLLIQITSFSQANSLQWVKSIGTIGSEYGSITRLDGNSNMYIVGNYESLMDVDGGSGVTNISLNGTDTKGTFLAKYDSNGNFLWVKTWGQSISFPDFEISNVGKIILATNINGSADTDPGLAVSQQTVTGILVLDLNGDYQTYYGLQPTNYNSTVNIRSVNIDRANNILISGEYRYSVDFNPGPGTNILTGTSIISGGNTTYNKHLYYLKLDINVNFVYVKNIIDQPSSLASYLSIIGIESDSLKAGYMLFQNVTTSGNPITYSVLKKLDSLGNIVWTKTIASSAPKSLTVSKGVYATCQSNTLATNSTTKYDFLGNLIWTKNLGQNYDILMKSDKKGDLYVSNTPISFYKYDKDGNLIWASILASNVNNSDFDIDAQSNIFWTGNLNATSTFTINTVPLSLSSNGMLDHCYGKLSNCIYDAPNICLVSVDSLAQNNIIYWDETPYAFADSFIVYRYDAFTTNYLKIGSVAKSASNNYLIDTARTIGGPNGGNPQYSSYRYKLAIKGTCGGIGTKGLYHESIFIQQNNQNFSWNAYGIEGQSSPATGYQFMRDNTNIGNWQVLVNTGGLSTTDPNYASYPNGNWRVDALGFSCNPTAKVNATVNRSKSNVKNNFVITSASELELKANISISPVPAKSELIVNFSNHQQTKTEYTITDVLGKVILKSETLNNDQVIISLNDISSGVYFLNIKQGKLQVTKKFVKE